MSGENTYTCPNKTNAGCGIAWHVLSCKFLQLLDNKLANKYHLMTYHSSLIIHIVGTKDDYLIPSWVDCRIFILVTKFDLNCSGDLLGIPRNVLKYPGTLNV